MLGRIIDIIGIIFVMWLVSICILAFIAAVDTIVKDKKIFSALFLFLLSIAFGMAVIGIIIP